MFLNEAVVCHEVMRLWLRFKRKKTEGPNLATREKDKVETIYILERHDLPNQKLKLVSDRTIVQSQFEKNFGQLQYLGPNSIEKKSSRKSSRKSNLIFLL